MRIRAGAITAFVATGARHDGRGHNFPLVFLILFQCSVYSSTSGRRKQEDMRAFAMMNHHSLRSRRISRCWRWCCGESWKPQQQLSCCNCCCCHMLPWPWTYFVMQSAGPGALPASAHLQPEPGPWRISVFCMQLHATSQHLRRMLKPPTKRHSVEGAAGKPATKTSCAS